MPLLHGFSVVFGHSFLPRTVWGRGSCSGAAVGTYTSPVSRGSHPPGVRLLCTLCNLSLVQSAPGTLRCCWMSSVCLKSRKIAVLMKKNLWSTGTSLWINSSRASLKRIYLFPQPPRRWPQRTKHSVTLDERGSTDTLPLSSALCIGTNRKGDQEAESPGTRGSEL